MEKDIPEHSKRSKMAGFPLDNRETPSFQSFREGLVESARPHQITAARAWYRAGHGRHGTIRLMVDLFDLTLPRCPAPNTSVIFSDESSQKEDFFVLGALYLWLPSGDYKRHIARLESKLTKLKADYGLGTVKWEKVPKPGRMLESYKALVRYLASLKDRIKFKCMIVDTNAYPLGHRTINDGDELVGYMKYYTVFLTDGIMLTQRGTSTTSR
jgi:hypothetical protein